MTTAFILGNGLSRKGIDLNLLKSYGRVYGCNALYREFTPDVLIATDRPMAEHIQNTVYSAQNQFYTRRPIEGLGGMTLPESYYGFSSGPAATGVAASHGHRRIYLLGFDMSPSANNTINNLYAGTEFYKPRNANPIFTGNWVRQLTKIAQDHRQVNFIRIQTATTAKIAQLESLPNLAHLDLDTFLDRINNKKDL
jgi:hypothetical protein